MKKIIKSLCKMYKTNTVHFDGLFYSVIVGNKAIVVRPRGKQFIVEKKMIFA